MSPANRRPSAEATAVFSDAFQFPGSDLAEGAPAYIERDRLVMAARPGMVRKLLPLRVDPDGVFCGGCYLFDTWENARDYGRWVAEEFALDGRLFLDRPEFLEPTSQLWRVVGVDDIVDDDAAQRMMRFQRWHLPEAIDVDRAREEHWPAFSAAARAAGLTSAWLLAGTDEHHPQLGVVLVADGDPTQARSADPEPLGRLEGLGSPGDPIARDLGGTKVFDRTSWVYMIWHPIEEGETASDTATWPVSPPLPGLDDRG